MSAGAVFVTVVAVFTGLVVVGIFVLWIWAIVDAVKSDFKDSSTKLIWMALLIFLPVIGTLVYFFAAKGTKIQQG